MITRLTLQNFGLFDVHSIDLAPLTLLAGYNHTGKSTILKDIIGLRDWDVASPNAGGIDSMKRE